MEKPIFIVDPFVVYLPDLLGSPIPYSTKLNGFIVRVRKNMWNRLPPIMRVLTTEDSSKIADRLCEAEALLTKIRASGMAVDLIDEYFGGDCEWTPIDSTSK